MDFHVELQYSLVMDFFSFTSSTHVFLVNLCLLNLLRISLLAMVAISVDRLKDPRVGLAPREAWRQP